jgi:hypothetical protein
MDANEHLKFGASGIASVLIFLKAFLALFAGKPDTYLLIASTHAFMGFAVGWKQVWVPLFVFLLFTVNIPVYLANIANPSYAGNFLPQVIFCLVDIAVSLLVYVNYRYYFGWTK